VVLVGWLGGVLLVVGELENDGRSLLLVVPCFRMYSRIWEAG
jgi:hypothetical protein